MKQTETQRWFPLTVVAAITNQTRPQTNLYACTAYEKHLQKQFKFSNLAIKSNLVH